MYNNVLMLKGKGGPPNYKQRLLHIKSLPKPNMNSPQHLRLHICKRSVSVFDR